MKTQAYLLFDERMALHRPTKLLQSTGYQPMENPNRIFQIFAKLMDLEQRLARESTPMTTCTSTNSRTAPQYQDRFVELSCPQADRDTVLLAHSPGHYDWVYQSMFRSETQLMNMTDPEDLYMCHSTFVAASLACGGVVQCVDAVTNKNEGNDITRAIAVVRPPGHHAGREEAMGFCFFNNVAVGAKHAIHTKRAQRVFILDYDIHHGNGIQDIVYNDPNIFYLSIHRASFDDSSKRSKKNEWFYPGTGRPDEVGEGLGSGTNLNLAWPKGGMGNEEYTTAFMDLVLPALESFQPDLIMIACGLDAAEGDLLGDCGLSPDMYYIMTRSLLEKAGVDIPFVVVLEGGYNIAVSAECMEAVALGLLDEPYDGDHFYDLSRYLRDDTVVANQHHSKRKKTKAKSETALCSIMQSIRAFGSGFLANQDVEVQPANKKTKVIGDSINHNQGPRDIGTTARFLNIDNLEMIPTLSEYPTYTMDEYLFI